MYQAISHLLRWWYPPTSRLENILEWSSSFLQHNTSWTNDFIVDQSTVEWSSKALSLHYRWHCFVLLRIWRRIVGTVWRRIHHILILLIQHWVVFICWTRCIKISISAQLKAICSKDILKYAMNGCVKKVFTQHKLTEQSKSNLEMTDFERPDKSYLLHPTPSYQRLQCISQQPSNHHQLMYRRDWRRQDVWSYSSYPGQVTMLTCYGLPLYFDKRMQRLYNREM